MSAPGPRKEVGSAESSRLHPPHVDENAQGAPAQASSSAPNDVPVLPANAHGRDVTPDTRPGSIDRASMYDRRPEEHKDYDAGEA